MDTGEYRNQIPSLSALDIRDYEKIFKVFSVEDADKTFYYYNILKKVEFPEIDSTFLGEFEVKGKMALTTISYEIYGDIKSWWIIYLLNKDQFEGAPFTVPNGTKLKYILDEVRSAIYQDITQSTVFGGRHY